MPNKLGKLTNIIEYEDSYTSTVLILYFIHFYAAFVHIAIFRDNFFTVTGDSKM
jgi:cytochrome b561